MSETELVQAQRGRNSTAQAGQAWANTVQQWIAPKGRNLLLIPPVQGYDIASRCFPGLSAWAFEFRPFGAKNRQSSSFHLPPSTRAEYVSQTLGARILRRLRPHAAAC